MYEKYFECFSYVDKQSPFCVVRLNEPYAGVQVMIGRQFGVVIRNGQQELQFDYQVVELPEEFDAELVKTDEFIGMVRNIFMAILEEQLATDPVYIKMGVPVEEPKE